MEVESKIMEHVKSVLKTFENKYITKDGNLKKQTILDDLDAFNKSLMTKLFSDKLIYNSYVEKVNGVDVFKLNQFIKMFEYKEFWEDSYTKYSNKIGLSADNKFIDESSDIVLNFPYKDSVLKAGMTKEDKKQHNEPFLNEIIAKPEIDELLEPKIFNNVKKYDQDGVHDTDTFSNDDNLIVKANNLIALHSIKRRYAGKVKLIYLDPPYNTDSDAFVYNDSFSGSAWLTFMKNRLEIAKQLLSEDGFIFIHTDDGELHYLKVLMDSIFGESEYLNTIVIKSKTSSGASGGGKDKRLKKNTEFLTVYAKPEAQIHPQKSSKRLDEYISERKSFAYKKVLVNKGHLIPIGKTYDGSGKEIKLFKVTDFVIKPVKEIAKEENISDSKVYLKYLDRIFTTENAQTSIRDRVKKAADNSEYVIARYTPVSGKNKGKCIDVGFMGATRRLVSFLKETSYVKNNTVYKTEKTGTLWDDISWSSVKGEGSVAFDSGEKPEKLLKRVIASATNKNDIVLDFFMGSATTQAVAMKMHRRFIGIEQMDYIKDISVSRLKNVIDGDQSGISKDKDINWNGGSSFVYADLMKKNRGYLDDLMDATNIKELDSVYNRMKNIDDLDFRVDLSKYEKECVNLKFEDRQRLLVKMLDKNQLYYNYNNIDDSDVKDLLTPNEYKFNKSFYAYYNK